jgi:hypothetical protein
MSTQIPTTDTRSRLQELADIALELLPRMLDPETALFSHKTLRDGARYVNKRPNLAYSAMSVVGLLEQPRRPADEVVPLGRCIDALHTGADLRPHVVVDGNLLWACALADDRRAVGVVTRLVDRMKPSVVPSSELGVALFGLVAAARAFPECRDRAGLGAERAANELLERFMAGPEVFPQQPPRLRLRHGTLQRGITSFASQVYPLHGLAAWYEWTGTTPAAALGRVASGLVEAQGAQGQWWWLYSPHRRAVVEGYPVYSVHQDGMAFLGLVPLQEIGLDAHWDALGLGLRWLDGHNELSESLVAEDNGFICRCIQRAGSDADGPYGLSRWAYNRVLVRSLRPPLDGRGVRATPAELEILRECRSYHLGWVLCAHALAERAGGKTG